MGAMNEAATVNPAPLIRARYVLQERLGAGGQGEVWRAHDPQRDEDIALKILRLAPGRSAAAWDALRHEYESASRLDHPFILKVYEPERLRNLHQNRHDREIIRTAETTQVTTRRKLHRQEERPVLALGLIHLEDEGMVETARALVFVAQRLPGRTRTPRGESQDLQRDVLTALRIVRAPDLPLTADAQSLLKDVARPDKGGWINRCRLVH